MKPSFFDYFNRFMRWRESNSPTDKVAMFYISLLDTFNCRGWEEWTGIDTPLLMMLANTTDKKTAYRARDELVQAGWIEYKPGKKGKPSEYRLLIRGANRTENDTDSAPRKPETKPKKEPPSAPSDAPPHDVQRQRFEMFWQEYPKKVGRKAALASWEKIKPDDILYERIMYAILMAKGSEQWQRENGRYIPTPARWLNESRWDDELPQTPKPAAAVPSYEETADDWQKFYEEGYTT